MPQRSSRGRMSFWFVMLLSTGCLLGISQLAPAATATDSTFSWGTANGSNNFITPPVSQSPNSYCCGECAQTRIAEAWYKMTRDDPTSVWCSSLSQKTTISYSRNAGSGASRFDFNYFSDPSEGLLTASDLPWTHGTTGMPEGPDEQNWTIADWIAAGNGSPADMNRRLFITSPGNNPDSAAYDSPFHDVNTIKQLLLANGPMIIHLNNGGDYTNGSGSYDSTNYTCDHWVAITGWVDQPQYPGEGGGYFLASDSGNGQTSKIAYASIYKTGDGTQGNGLRISNYIGGPAYFDGELNSATWNGAAGHMNWNTTGTNTNWIRDPDQGNGTPWQGTPAGTWLNGETAATFGATGAGTVTVASLTSAYGITINSAGYTFTGGSLIVTGAGGTATGGGIIANQSVAFNTPITVGAPSTWTVASGRTLTANAVNLHISTLTIDGGGNTVFNGTVADVTDNVNDPAFAGLLTGYTGSLIKNGSGTLTLNAANTFSGNMTLNQGSMAFGNPNALQKSTLVFNGGTLAVTGGAATSLNLGGLAGTVSQALPTMTALAVGANNANTTYSGNLTLGGSNASLTKAGTGTLALLGPNSYAGNTNINGGLLEIAGLANIGSGPLVFGGGGLQFGGSFDPSARMLVNSDFTLDTNDNDVTLANPIGNNAAASLTKVGAGILTLSAANTYTGNTCFNGGLIRAAGFANLGGGSATQLVFDGGGLQWAAGAAAFDPSSRTMIFNAGGGTLDTNGNNVTLANTINTAGGSGTLVKTGVGTLTLTASSGLGGAVIVNGGALVLGGTAGALILPGTITINNGSNLVLDDAGLSGPGPVRITPNSAGVVVNAGELKFNGSNNAAGDSQTLSKIQIGGPATITVAPGSAQQATLNIAGNLSTNRTAGASLLVRGTNLGGSGASLAKVFVNGATGPTLSNSGTGNAVGILPYALGDTSAAGSGMGLVTYDATNGVRLLNTGTEYNSSLSGGNNNVRLTASPAALGTTTTIRSLTLDGGSSPVALDLSGYTLKLNSGALVSTGVANTISGGTLTALYNSTDKGTSLAECFFHTISDLTVNSTIANAGNPPINPAVTLVKDGPGCLTLTAANKYSLGTKLNAGTLVLANATGSGSALGVAGVVLNGGTLSSISGVDQSVNTILAGSGPHTISPGGDGGIGSFTLTGGLTLNSNSTLDFDYSGGTWDTIHDTAGMTFASGDTGSARILISSGGWSPGGYSLIDFASTTLADLSHLSLGPIGGGTWPASYYSLTLGTAELDLNVTALSGDVNVDGNVDGTDLGILINHMGTQAGADWAMGDVNNDGRVDGTDLGLLINNMGQTALSPGLVKTGLSIVPEPSTLELLAVGLTGLLVVARRRRTRAA